MRRSSEPEERAQFTVAELLARYGDSAPTTGRRHRRATDDDSGAATAAVDSSVAVDGAVARNWAASPEPAIRPVEPQPPADATQPHVNGRGGQLWTPAVGSPSVIAGRAPITPPVFPTRAPTTRPTHSRSTLSDGPVTDQLPRVEPAAAHPASRSGLRPASSYPASPHQDRAQPPAGLGTTTRVISEPTENVTVADEAQESGSPMWEWAVMVSQVGMGIAGGAALWLICEWLWQRIPVVALVVALAVITGLVWVVRRVRRTEDLQTTVIAVLVGLFVTVSPAALLLVGR